MFESKKGWLHFLFANPNDDYYTYSGAKMDEDRYLFYQLKNKGYKGVFFIQELQNQEKPVVRTEDYKSAEIYGKEARKGKTPWSSYSDIGFESKTVAGKMICELKHLNDNELRERILTLFSSNEKYAFIFPMRTYIDLYKEDIYRNTLISQLSKHKHKDIGKKSIFIITASCFAEDSLYWLRDDKNVFDSSLGDKVRDMKNRKDRFLWYPMMASKLGDCYNVWNQFRKCDIERMFRYGVLCENWSLGKSCLEDYIDFIYAWYHSSAFESCYPKLFPSREKHSQRELSAYLRQNKGQIWETMEQEIMRLNESRSQEERLLAVIEKFYQVPAESEIIHPILSECGVQHELQNIKIEELIPDKDEYQKTLLIGRFNRVVRELHKPWNKDNINVTLGYSAMEGSGEKPPLECCADLLSKLRSAGRKSLLAVDQIVKLMEYSVTDGIDDIQQGFSELFDKKIKYLKAAVNNAIAIADKQWDAQQCKAEIQLSAEKLSKAKKLFESNPYKYLLDETITEITPELKTVQYQQNEINRLKNELQFKKIRYVDILSGISDYTYMISRINEAVAQLKQDGLSLDGLTAMMDEMTEEVKAKKLEEARYRRKLDTAFVHFDTTLEELQKYVEDNNLNDSHIEPIFAERSMQVTSDIKKKQLN